MRESVLPHLQHEVRPMVLREIVEAAESYGSEAEHRQNFGHFSIPRQVFAVVDHLGSLVYGKGATQRSLAFIREYFPERYTPYADVLYAMWRHGVVHAWQPYSYWAEVDGIHVQLRWLSSNHARPEERRHHLIPYRHGSDPSTVVLVVNTCELANDLLLALDAFIRRLEMYPQLDLACAIRLDQNQALHGTDFIRGNKNRRAVEAQIAQAWRDSGGRLEDGNVRELHPDVRAPGDA